MIQIARWQKGVRLQEIWFAPRPLTMHALWPVQYLQCEQTAHAFGFKRKEFATKIIDLSRPQESLQEHLEKAAAYEIRRAERDGVCVTESHDLKQFLEFHNAFAAAKGLAQVGWRQLQPLAPFLTILQARHDETPLVMHAYLMDRPAGRSRLLYSSSHFRASSDLGQKALIGRANRFLHWSAMLHFKKKGFLEYDLGGYALQTSDPQLKGINQFKDSFGGQLRVEGSYTSYLLHGFQIIARKLKKT